MALFCNLPSGGSGLPSGVSAMTCGTYTPNTKITAPIEIQHGLGVKPNFCIVRLEKDTSSTALNSCLVLAALFEKKNKASSELNSYVYNTNMMVEGYDSSYTLKGGVTYNQLQYLTETIITIPSDYIYNLPAGYTYKWVCGVLDGIE